MIEFNKNLDEYEPNMKKSLKTFSSIFIDKPKWPLHSKKWSRLKCQNVLKECKQIKAEEIDLYMNLQCDILKPLLIPSFTQLTELNLKNNKIVSIEILQQIEIPKIKVLNFSDNNLTTIASPLNKCFFPELQKIILYANNIIEGETKNYVFDLGENIEQIFLGVNYLTNLRWINKLQNLKNIKFISLENNRGRIYSSTQRWVIALNKLFI